jgi:hypothetical protein
MSNDIDLPAGFRPVYPLRDAFSTLAISAPTGYRLIETGELRTYQIGARRYVAGTELVRFIREREQVAGNVDASRSADRARRGRAGANKRHGTEPPEAA